MGIFAKFGGRWYTTKTISLGSWSAPLVYFATLEVPRTAHAVEIAHCPLIVTDETQIGP